jgi:5-methylcytosine-specific restriction enzyme subunit McrC
MKSLIRIHGTSNQYINKLNVSRTKPIQVFEFEKLTLKADLKGRYLTQNELVKLLDFNDRNKNAYFNGIRDGIQFKNYVGVIQIGGLTIEILPKADKQTSSIDNDYKTWHNVLLSMLKVCKQISVNSISEANLTRRNNSLLELYFEIYLNEVESLLRNGLIKNYRKKFSNVLTLKGRLEFNKNIQQNCIHQERFYTHHQIYDFENLANQILLRALTILSSITTSFTLKDKISRLKLNFPDIKEIPIEKSHFDNLRENRKAVSYIQALQIAKMIILNYSPDIRSGQENMLALLFDMNKLWEEYIYRMLLKTKRNGISISFQNEQDFWEKRTIRPDIVLKHQTETGIDTYIIDTKWKVLDIKNPKPSDDDLKQMYTYNLYWNAKKSMLLYPHSHTVSEIFGKFWKGTAFPEDNQCKIGFISVLDKNNILDINIGDKIIDKLNFDLQ